MINEIPDHFNKRPTAIGSTSIAGHIRLDRTQVDSLAFTVSDNQTIKVQFNNLNWAELAPHLGYDIRFLAPAFRMRIYMWVSMEANGNPIGGKILGNVKSSAVLWDLHRNDTVFWLATKGEERPQLRLDPGTYWLNSFYYGSTNSTLVNRTVSIQDAT